MRIPGVCNRNQETTVWAHANGSAAGKGMGIKAPDVLGTYACMDCHDAYDRRKPLPHFVSRDEVKMAFWEGHARSVVMLIEKGLVVCK